MASVAQIISVIQPDAIFGLQPRNICSVACHPADVSGPDCLFFCINEYLEYNKWQTWRTHLEVLPELPLGAVVVPEHIDGLPLTQIVVAHPRRALGRVARLLSGNPDEQLSVYGVTGTNGKTTTTRLLAHMLGRLSQPCGSIGTLGVRLEGSIDDSGTYTTPLAPSLYKQLARLREAGARAVAMEVSSHGLALDRVEGILFDSAILTNVERDHLDFHGTQEAYAEAKRRLFGRVRRSGRCVLNRHSPYCDSFASASSAEVVTYGRGGSGADFELTGLELHADRSLFRVRYAGVEVPVQTQLVGSFQVENVMAALAALAGRGHSMEAIAGALATFPAVCGRMERFTLPNGATAIVDYAHNPDGLRQVLESCRVFSRGRLHVVFGCGGDRDRGNGPIMGHLAATLADAAWVSSDNPRTEDPGAIIRDILEGCRGGTAEVNTVADRREAIGAACSAAGPEDVVLIAGKGHEDYQLIGYTKYPFSDQGVLRDLGACQKPAS